MKKICSILLSTAIIITAIFCPTAGISASVATAGTASPDVIINTFEEEGFQPNGTNGILADVPDLDKDGKSVRFGKITSLANTTGKDISHFVIYVPEKFDGGYRAFKPKTSTTYKLTFDYRTRSSNNFDLVMNIRGVTGGVPGDALCRAVTVKKSLQLNTNALYKVDTATVYFTTPDTPLDSLAITAESKSASDQDALNIAIDNVKLQKASSSFVVANTFEEDDVTVDTLNRGTDITIFPNNNNTVVERTYADENTTSSSGTLRTNNTLSFRAVRTMSNSNKVHFEIYDYSKGLDANNKLQSFKPEVDSDYKITFDYKIMCSNTSTVNIYYNIRPVTVSGGTRTLGEPIATAIDIPGGDPNHPRPATEWHTATVNVPVTSNVDALAITIETNSSGNFVSNSFIDNVVVEKNDTDVITNTYDETGLGTYNQANTSKPGSHKLVSNNLYYLGIKAAADPNTTRVVQFYPVTGQNEIEKGNITHIELYNPYDKDFTTASSAPSIKPLNNSVYKITFDFKIRASSYGNIFFNIRGKKDGVLGEILGNAAVIEKGDPAYSDYTWGTAEAYIYTGDNDALAITVEADTDSDALLYPYLDDITVTPVKEYGSGVISEIAPAENNKNGLLAIKNGKLFEMAENDYAKVNFTVDTDTAIANSSIVARIIDDNGDVSDVTLFDFSAYSGKKIYNTTFKANKSGKVVISVYKNDSTVVNKNVTISDLTIDAHTPSDLKGDVNLDGEVDIVDLTALRKKQSSNYVLSGEYLENADLNESGAIDDGDLTDCRKQILGNSANSEN